MLRCSLPTEVQRPFCGGHRTAMGLILPQSDREVGSRFSQPIHGTLPERVAACPVSWPGTGTYKSRRRRPCCTSTKGVAHSPCSGSGFGPFLCKPFPSDSLPSDMSSSYISSLPFILKGTEVTTPHHRCTVLPSGPFPEACHWMFLGL